MTVQRRFFRPPAVASSLIRSLADNRWRRLSCAVLGQPVVADEWKPQQQIVMAEEAAAPIKSWSQSMLGSCCQTLLGQRRDWRCGFVDKCVR